MTPHPETRYRPTLLGEADLAAIVEMALQHVAPTEPQLITAIRDGTLASVYRTPFGEQLSSAG